jgi:small subunit ribosomal protein S1
MLREQTITRFEDQNDEPSLLEINYDQTFHNFKQGEVVKGHVLRVTENEVLVDIGYKSEGVIAIYEFKNGKALKPGDEVDVYIDEMEDEKGRCILSRRKAERSRGWDDVIAKYKEGDIVAARPVRKVKGGLMVDVEGVEAFLPASLAFIKGFGNLNALVEQAFDIKIIKINPERRNIIVSRKDVLEAEKQVSKDKILSELEVGTVRNGVVKNITDFGAFVNLGGIDGLLHITDMSWGRISHPSEIVKIGDKIDVKILHFDKATHKVSLGLKQLLSNPWDDVENRFPIGTRVQGRVVNIVPYGVFVEIDKGIEGLVHVSEISWSKRVTNPSEIFKPGEIADVMVLAVDKANQKISLGIRQTADNPWVGIEDRYSVGTRIKGTVWNLTDFGAFVQVESGIDGLIHISDMSWTKKVSHPKELLKKGQEIDAVVLSVDQIKRKLSLGLKQLEEDPWVKISERYPSGSVVEGVVSKSATFGVFVEVEKDIEGLLHISEMNQDQATTLETHFPAGKKLNVKILKVDSAAHKIALSIKGV